MENKMELLQKLFIEYKGLQNLHLTRHCSHQNPKTTNLLIDNHIVFLPARVTGHPLFRHFFRVGRIGVLVIAENPFELARTKIAVDFLWQNAFLWFAASFSWTPGLLGVHALLKITGKKLTSKLFLDNREV